MKKLEIKSRKVLRKIFGGISFTAMAFVFQACYGTPLDNYYDVKFTGTVRSKTTQLPIKGIKVTVNQDGYNYGITNEDGQFDFYAAVSDERNYKDGVSDSPNNIRVDFVDIDGIENGHFADTALFLNSLNKHEVIVDVDLREIE